MATFKIEIKEYNGIACIQIQSLINVPRTKVDIDEDGNGSIRLFALNTDEAMNFARKCLEIYKKP